MTRWNENVTRLHGFVVRSCRDLAEIRAQLVEMEYEKNGARLLWLNRDDENMSFAITFKTIPTDDTGVFHILEHSVLNGSDRYPVKEPFVNLLQSSLQTFLNAMTFPDKTMYPVASRNKKDFHNLVSVYMDAVLHPLIYRRPETFRQEGWHYEWDDKGKLVCNGVVYNEMKGAYGSVDTQLDYHVNRLLLPDTCYRYDSGGNPDSIPDLTYEQFLATHRKFYHPSNAYIVLDGSVDLEDTLSLLDGFLRDYDRHEVSFSVGQQPAIAPAEYEDYYETDAETEKKGLCHYAQSFVCGSFDEREKSAALRLLGDVLCGSNEAPLKKAVVQSGLAENIDFAGSEDGIRYLEAGITARNVAEKDLPRLKQVIRDTLTELADKGIDRELLTASLNAMEFAMRERDYGSMPKGLVFAFLIMESWLYGGDPAAKLCCGDLFDRLRQKAEEGWFESLIRELLLNNPHNVTVVLKPSASCGEERRTALQKKLDALERSWSEAERNRIADQADALRMAQQTEDTPEQLSTLPHLALADVKEKAEPLLLDVDTVSGRTVLRAPYDTNGIVYSDLYFDISDFTEEELMTTVLLGNVLDEMGTAHHTGEEMQKLLKTNLGGFSCGVDCYGKPTSVRNCKPYFVVGLSALESKQHKAAQLVGEMLNEAVFRDGGKLRQILRQKKLAMREEIADNGTVYAATRVGAAFSARGVIREYVSGIEHYRFISRLGEADIPALLEKLAALRDRIFTADRLTLSVTGHPEESFVREVITAFPVTGEKVTSRIYAPLNVAHEGIAVPTDVCFTALGANLHALGRKYKGSMNPAALLMSYGYFWNVIRVQNGAYGAGMSVGDFGDLRFTTYRDPNAANSLDTFRAAADFLRANPPEPEELTDLVISAIGDIDPLRTPRTSGRLAAARYLLEVDQTYIDGVRRQMLHTSVEDVLAFADEMERICSVAGSCVIGSRELIEKCGNRLDTVTELN